MTRIRSTAESLAIRRDLQERLADARSAGLPDRDVENAAVLVEAGEYVIALENLATQLTELEIDLPPIERAALLALGSRLHLDVARLLG